ncbi:MAG TPA: alpha/beta hydrolase, partial [Candidatus Binataceae bacterium]|nr:alpha/beta hydrolase [Candidatus Binataceae bacterium]
MATTRDYATTKDGVKLRYEIRGNGDPLALIMGFSGSGRGWGEPFLSGMEKRYRTVVIDNRGTGESDKPDAPWTMTDMANDIAAVLDHAKIPRAHIYGISMGGMIAQELALRHPGKVRKLVLGCTTTGGPAAAAPAEETIAALLTAMKLMSTDPERAIDILLPVV